MQAVTTDELKTVIALNDLPVEHLQWILDHSEYREYEDGSLIMKTGEPAEVMIIILEGRVNFYLDVNGRLVYYFSFTNDKLTGGVGGLLPYSRMKVYPGNSYAVGKLRVLVMHKQHFLELEHLNADFIQRLIGYMTERAKAFVAMQMQQEKVSALGNLAAGIAHELNNPAAAIDRMSSELTKRLARNYSLTEKLLQHKISSEHARAIRALVETKEQEQKVKLSPLQRMEKEDEITNWIEAQGLLGNHLAGETFAEAGFSSDDLESIRNNVGKEAFIQVLHWLENLLSSQRTMKDLEEASKRISGLVGAIKSHVHMDRTHELQPTDIHKDLDNTITLLGHKLRDKNITVKRSYCENHPDVPAYVGELNQVWTNLIDNAIYAMEKNGELKVETSCDPQSIHVKIIDNGSGIPPEIISRIFDPFFTTKKVGMGSGIGLDLVRRIIKHHNGDINVHSKPGRTEFLVRIPLAEIKKKDE